MNLNIIICGDTLTKLKKLPDDCIDMVITSPPYYGLRNYGIEGQIGLEKTFEEYLEKILKITAEIKRVLKKTGTFWLNMGDCYGGLPAGNKSISEANIGTDGLYVRKMKQCAGAKSPARLTYWGGNVEKSTLTNPERQQEMGRSGNQKCMLMQPERLAIAMINKQGWILRNKIKWAKQVFIKKQNRTIGSVMPTSVKDRFNESGEELYFFVKSKKYYFDLDAVRLSSQTEPWGKQTRIKKGTTGGRWLNTDYFNYRVRDAKRKVGQPQFKASEKEVKSYEARMNDTKNKDQKSSRTYNIKKLLSEVRLGIKPNTGMERKKVLEIYGDDLKGSRRSRVRDFMDNKRKLEAPIFGKNLPTIWQIGSEPHNFQKEVGADIDHFAVFPEALVEIPILVGCPKGGIILDPFMGSGTTAIVAKKLNRNYIGIELNPNYCKIAEARIKATPNPLF